MPIGGKTIGERMAWCDREVQKIQQRLTGGVSPRQAERLATRLFRVAGWQRAALLSRDELVQQWLPLVKHVCGKFKRANPGLSMDDLIGAGHIGLILAAEQYRADSTASFKSYAYKAIWSHIVKECFHQRSLISIKNHKPDDNAEDKHASRMTMMSLSTGTLQLPAPERECLYEMDDFVFLAERLRQLPPRMREALERRYLDTDEGWQTLPAVASQMGIGVERARQLVESGLNRLRDGWPGLENSDEPIAKAS